jgi:hypothetical protein
MIKTIYLVVSMFLAIGFLSANISAQTPTPTPYIRTELENSLIQKAIDTAHQNGKATVIMSFDEPFVPNSPEYIARVRVLQNNLLQYLIPYQIRLIYLYTVIPGMALEGDEAALVAMRDYPRVKFFELDGVIHIPETKRKRIRVF